MRMHPVYAYETLCSIPYLLPALDIPYCHHERWDGSGYPRGLKGENIPLSARIFAVVDVWDALTSDRPYRKAWLDDRVVKYIHAQSGKMFDPKIVDMFFYLKGYRRVVDRHHTHRFDGMDWEEWAAPDETWRGFVVLRRWNSPSINRQNSKLGQGFRLHVGLERIQ